MRPVSHPIVFYPPSPMIAAYLDKARLWLHDTLRSSAIKGLSESVEGKKLKKALAPILCYIVVAAVLSSQLLLAQWPVSFAAFLLASPVIANAILGTLAIACNPAVASKVPLYACIGIAGLAALQCIMGAFAMCLPLQPHRTVFALLSSAVVLCLCLGVSKSFVKSGIQTFAAAKARVVPAGDDSEDGPAESEAGED